MSRSSHEFDTFRLFRNNMSNRFFALVKHDVVDDVTCLSRDSLLLRRLLTLTPSSARCELKRICVTRPTRRWSMLWLRTAETSVYLLLCFLHASRGSETNNR